MVEVKAKTLAQNNAFPRGLQVITVPDAPSAAQRGNQGTALVARKLTSFPSHYASAPSGKPSSCNTAYFRCAPRKICTDDKGRSILEIKVFERHPYTRQAFFPMGSCRTRRAYVVVVAEDASIYSSLYCAYEQDGKPDLQKVEAFIAKGNQGIVYEANRWHSPMCAIDEVFLYL